MADLLADTWITIPEMDGLPGLPGTRRGKLKASLRNHWESRPRAKGKGLEYRISSLPEATQTHLKAAAETARIAELVAAIPVPETLPIPAEPKPDPAEEALARQRRKAEGLAKFSALAPTHPKRLRAQGREWFVLACGQIVREEGMTLKAARLELAERVNLAKVPVPKVAADALPRRHGRRALTAATLKLWALDYERDGIWGLTDGYGNRKGGSKIEAQPALYRLVLGQMAATPQISGKDLYALARAKGEELAAHGVEIPGLTTFQRFMRLWKAENHAIWAAATNPGAYKSRYQLALGSHHEHIVRLNQLWEMDSTPGDWLLTDGRHSVIGCIDLYSRRLMLYVHPTSSAEAVGRCLRRAILAWGVPEEVRTDNGKDYTSRHMDTAFHHLGIKPLLCIPFASEQKGTIERALQTVTHGVCKLLPGYIGHNVAEREAIRARETFAKRVMTPGETIEVSMSGAELQRTLDQWVEAVYHQDPHSGEGMRGMTPFAKAAAWTGEVRTVDPRALDFLLLTFGETRNLTKNGIRWDNREYIARSGFEGQVGNAVFIRYDPADLGRIYVFSEDRFLCVAECPEMTGISRAEYASAARAEQKKLDSEKRAELKAMKKEQAKNPAEVVLKYRAKQSGKLVEFPRETTPYTTPMLDAAAEAARASEPAPMRIDTPEQIAVAAALDTIQAPVGGGSNVVQLETSRTRYLKWLKVDAEVVRGEHADGSETLRWWRAYQECAEFKAEKIMSEDPSLEAYGPTGKARG
jgi:transposase InsO family protein